MTPNDPRLTLIATMAKVRPPHVYHVYHAMRMRSFDAEAFAAFAQLELKHVRAIIAALAERSLLPTKPRRESNSSFDTVPDGVPVSVWEDFLRNRAKKGLPNTGTAYESVIKKLDALCDMDWDRARLMTAIVAEGWGGVYDPRGRHIEAKVVPVAKSSEDMIAYKKEQVLFYRKIGRHWQADDLEAEISRDIAKLESNVIDAAKRFG
jgi:hypothetical protein